MSLDEYKLSLVFNEKIWARIYYNISIRMSVFARDQFFHEDYMDTQEYFRQNMAFGSNEFKSQLSKKLNNEVHEQNSKN